MPVFVCKAALAKRSTTAATSATVERSSAARRSCGTSIETCVKANYASGFRPPVFNNTDSNGAAVQFGGSHFLSNERAKRFRPNGTPKTFCATLARFARFSFAPTTPTPI